MILAEIARARELSRLSEGEPRRGMLRYRAAFYPRGERRRWTMRESASIALDAGILRAIARGDASKAADFLEFEMVADALGDALATDGETTLAELLELNLEVE